MKRDTTILSSGKLMTLRHALVILASILTLTGCNTGQSNLKQAERLLPGKWALVGQEAVWYSLTDNNVHSDTYSFSVDESPLTMIINHEKIACNYYSWFEPAGPYQLQVYDDEVYILLDGATSVQNGNPQRVVKILSIDDKYLRLLLSNRNADGSADRFYFQRLE